MRVNTERGNNSAGVNLYVDYFPTTATRGQSLLMTVVVILLNTITQSVAFKVIDVFTKNSGNSAATNFGVITPGRRQSKTPIPSRNVDKKSIETLFSIAIWRHTGDKINGNRKNCFYRFFIRVRRLLIAFSIAAYPVW